MARRSVLPDDLVFNVDYLGGQVGTFAINFSRPAGQVISQYYKFLRLGREGYTEVQMACYDDDAVSRRRDRSARALRVHLHGSEKTGIPAICFRIKTGAKPAYTLYDLSDRLRLRGWQVPAFLLAGDAARRHGHADHVPARLRDGSGFAARPGLQAALAFLKKHPVSAQDPAAEGAALPPQRSGKAGRRGDVAPPPRSAARSTDD